MFGLQVAAGPVGLFVGQAVDKGQEETRFAEVDGQRGGFAIHLEGEAAVALVALLVAGGGLHDDLVLIGELLHLHFQAQGRVLGEVG